MSIFTPRKSVNQPRPVHSDAFETAKHDMFAWSMKPFHRSDQVWVHSDPLCMTADEVLEAEKIARDLGIHIIWK